MNGGVSFTIKSNCQNYNDDGDDDSFHEQRTELEVSDDFLSPWDKSFAELIPAMTNITKDICTKMNVSPVKNVEIYKKMIRRPADDEEIQGRCRVTIAYNAYFEKARNAFDSTYMRKENKIVSKN